MALGQLYIASKFNCQMGANKSLRTEVPVFTRDTTQDLIMAQMLFRNVLRRNKHLLLNAAVT